MGTQRRSTNDKNLEDEYEKEIEDEVVFMKSQARPIYVVMNQLL